MSTIGGDGGIRWAPEPRLEPGADAIARAAEMARRLAAMLDERNARAAQETARLLVEVPRLPAEAHETFLSAAADPSPGPPQAHNELAQTVRERIAQAFPEGSDRRRKLGAALVSLEGGEPGAVGASALEAKVARALGKLGAFSSASTPSSAARTPTPDTMERRRGFGPFSGPTVLPESSANQLPIETLSGAVQAGVSLAPTASLLRDKVDRALEALPETWRGVVARAQELAPGLTTGIVPLGRAESLVTAVRQGLAGIGEGQSIWARARAAAGENVMGGIAARFEGVREGLAGSLETAATLSGVTRAESLAALAREARGEAAFVRQDIAWAQELVPVGSAQDTLTRADVEMGAADYGLQAYSTQQDVVAGQAQGPERATIPGEAPPALTPEMITPEVIEELRTSGQVPPEVLAQLESGDITPELLAQLQGAGPGGITQEELDRIGTGITEAPPAQGFWNIGTVGAGMEPAFSCDEYCQATGEAVNRIIGDATSVRPLEGGELAAAIRDVGVPLEKLDPNQLGAALSYINSGASGAVTQFGRGAPQTVEEQRERLALALRQFRCLADHGAAPMDRTTATNVMWSAARIPGHAFEKMSDAEVLAAAQQTAAAVNTPGNHEFKVGKHTVKLTIGEGGAVESTSTKAPSFWGTLGKIAKGALTVASFIPGPVGLVARGIQAGITLVNTIRHGGGLLNLVAAGASFVGAGAAAVGRLARTVPSVARIAGNVARVANAVSGVARGVQGIQRGGIGGILSGAAGVMSGVSGGLQAAGVTQNSPLGRFASDLSSVGRDLSRVGAGVSAAEGYVHANRAVSEAREAVQQARATGDATQIRQAEQQLAEAERAKRSAVLGGMAAVGQIAGDTLARDSSGQTEARAGEVPAQGRSAFQVGAEIFSRGMNAARGINERDFLTAGVEALGGVAAARQGTKPIADEYVIGPDGKRIQLRDDEGNLIPNRFQMREDFSALNEVSSVLDGLNDWRGAERGEGQARSAVDQAEQALSQARVSGNPEAIQEAEANLRQARQGLVQAELGSTFALDNAAQRFTGAVDTFNNSRAADGFHAEERHEQGLIEQTRRRTGSLAADMAQILRRPDATPTEKEWAVDQLLALARADQAYEEALRTGDPTRAREARLALQGVHKEAGLPPPLARVASVGVPDVPRVFAIRPRETQEAEGRPAATFYAGPVEEFGVMAEKVAEGYEPRDPSAGLFLSPEQLQDLATSEETKAQRAGANKEWAEARLGRLDELLGEGFGQYAEIRLQESAFHEGQVDPSRILEALEGRVGQYAALEVPELRDALGAALRDAKPGDVLDVSELYSVAYQSSRARALSVAESIGEPGSIRYWSALVGQADYAPADLVNDARLALVGQTADALGLALGAYAVGRGAAQVGRAFLREHFAPPPTGVMKSPVNRGVGTANPVGYVTDVYADYRLRAIQRQVTAEVDAAIAARDFAKLRALGAEPGEAAWALRGEEGARFRGTIIDLATKDRASNTFDLQWLKYTERGKYGPDVWNPWTMRAWDITTTAQWRRHVMKYVVTPKPARPVWRSLGPLLTK